MHRQLRPLCAALLATLFLSATAVQAEAQGRPTIADLATKVNRLTGEFSTLLAALDAAGLTEVLAAPTTTAFAPTDAAFGKLGLDETNVASLGVPALTEILTYHVADAVVKPGQLLRGKDVHTLNGVVDVTRRRYRVTLNKGGNRPARVLAYLPASNGSLYVINAVLDPSDAGGSDPE